METTLRIVAYTARRIAILAWRAADRYEGSRVRIFDVLPMVLLVTCFMFLSERTRSS